MEQPSATLTILFDDPFWVGVYERQCGRRYEACKITFGAEPKDWEIYAFLLDNWTRLPFSPSLAAEQPLRSKANPKRMQRMAREQLRQTGVGTKAQQALQLQREENKAERHERTKAEREAEKERQFALRQAKQKEKHRGR